MVKINAMYKCNQCGNVVEGIYEGDGELVCCGEPMVELKENSVDAAQEKHVPVIEEDGEGVVVKVGSVAHPMDEDHYISTIEVICKCGLILRRNLKPGEAPEAKFPVKREDVEMAREYCNKHGLWIAQ